MLSIWFLIMHCCTPTPTTDSNTSSGMIRVTLNMLSVVEECREPSWKCQGISRCLESGHLACMIYQTAPFSFFNDLEQTLTQFSRSRYSSTLSISYTVKDTAIVTMQGV